MKKIITYEFSDDDDKTSIRAAESGSDLALCIYLMDERIRKEWENCEENDTMDKLISDVSDIIESTIGNINTYTC